MMNRKKMFLIPVFAVAFALFAGYLVQVLWNHSMPLITDALHPIDYWTATCLLLLCRLLVGSFSKGGHGGPPWARKARMMRHLKDRAAFGNLSDEERQRLREEWRRRCGPPWGRREQE